MARVEVRKTYKMLAGGAFIRTESGRALQVGGVNVPRASRKDLRDAVKAARGAFAGWSGKTAMLRGQILYRCAEMLDARRGEFAGLPGVSRREVDDAVDTLVWYAGWCDKLPQLLGAVNPVAGPYFTFTIPEPTGVVAVIAAQPSLLGLVRQLAPVLCAGNTAVAVLPDDAPLAGLVLGEVIATSDVPAGVVNILSGLRSELLPWLASHMDVNAIDVGGCSDTEIADCELRAADNVKRVVRNGGALTPDAIAAVMEMKTVWHPVGA